ncbi:Fc.00g013080.m01.CDS01 [Cosmosporella sp. VM-42]
MVLPFVEVSHLASSTSFYSTVLQPLGLRYLSTAREPPLSVGTVTYGFKGRDLGQDEDVPILQIREASHPLEPLKRSSLVLTAPSRAAVADFHASGLNANPWLRIQDNEDYPGPSLSRLGSDGGVSRATIRDLDSNTMEVLYPPPTARSHPATHNGVPVRQTQSTRGEATRILDWNYDVASRSARSISHHSSSSSSHHSQAQSQARSQAPPRSRFTPSHAGPSGSVASGAMTRRPVSRHSDDAEPLPEPSISPRQSSSKSSLNTTNVVGALLGVAAVAGAALTYTMVSREKERKPRHDLEHPTLSRRATYPEKLPSTHEHHERNYGDYPPKTLPYQQDFDYGPPRISYPDNYPPRHLPFQDNYAPQKLPFQDEYVPRKTPYQDYATREVDSEDDDSDEQTPPEPQRQPVQYLTQRSHHGSTARSTTKSVPRSRVVEDTYDVRSRHSSKHTSSRAPSVRSRSEIPISRAPLMIADADQVSHTGSRQPKSSHYQARSHRPHYDPERDSYFSARSRRSSATATPRQSREPEVIEHEVVRRSRSGSRVTTAKISVSGGRPVVVGRSSRAPSRVSARDIELPMSGVGSSHANWDDDMESVAPSDSISCIGSKTSRRSRRTR